MGTKRRTGYTNDTRGGDAKDDERQSSEPAPKRQRVSRACDQCRSAREKCDGIQPLCFPCASQNRQCSWEEPKRKRGVQTGYMRTLEMALGWIFDKIPNSEESLHGLLTHEGGQGYSLIIGKENIGNRLHRRWRKSIVNKEINRVLSGGEAVYAKSMKGSPQDEESDTGDDETGSRGRVHSTSCSVPEITATATASGFDLLKEENQAVSPEVVRGPHGAPIQASRTEDGTDTGNTISSSPNSQKLPHNHWRLLDIYFAYTHSWFPVLDKNRVLKTAYTYASDMSQSVSTSADRDRDRDRDPAGYAELWAAMALASYQEEASRKESNDDASNDAFHPPPPAPTPTSLLPEDIYRIARNMIPLETGPFDVSHVNALLLLTLVNLAREDLAAAWILIGLTIRIALKLGVHEHSRTDPGGRSSHAYMGCFILDTLLSARLRLRPHLRNDDMADIEPPPPESDLDEWQPWVACPGFGHPSQETHLSRVPTHSASTFASLYRFHRVLSLRLSTNTTNTAVTEPEPVQPMYDDRYSTELNRIVVENNAQRPLAGFLLKGEPGPVPLPSLFLLRLAYLCSLPPNQHHPQQQHQVRVLQCIGKYIDDFGACAVPPLFMTYLELSRQQSPVGMEEVLTPEERDRWKQTEKTIASVWRKHVEVDDTNPNDDTSHEQTHTSHNPSSRNMQSTSSLPSITPQPQPTAAPPFYLPNTATPTLDSSSNMYTAGAGAPILEYPNHNPSILPQTPNDGMQLHGGMVGLPTFTQPAAAFDYDAILDDIASIDRTDMMEADPQFMANLGLRPGTNLAEIFSHEFMGFSR
ncbi:fungal-specific transcription factor domain-containing protein [Xylariomycetidae sp. FL0641]|nr:fungal-specific transcription factor domain-containing protein [Xylariomycetidae sp. FL0641]